MAQEAPQEKAQNTTRSPGSFRAFRPGLGNAERQADGVLGLAGNKRLSAKIAPHMRKAKRKAKRTGKPARVSGLPVSHSQELACPRRIIGKAEWTKGAANPRFIVTNVHPAFGDARFLYEAVYCQRGEMENRLKECQGELFADRTPAPTMRANQLRLWLASFAYILMCAVRRIGLPGTEMERATCGTIRLQLLKIGALVTIQLRYAFEAGVGVDAPRHKK